MKKILASVFVFAALISFAALSFAQDAKSAGSDTAKAQQQVVKPAKKAEKKVSRKHKTVKKTVKTKKIEETKKTEETKK